ncbi:HNH/ENDO VII family nuclease, partial [Streptomyces sp. S.PNR 29]|uniref:HNH/ENDO VII family nuclease n=1 Tax=Streptomyces sp. S.PNR 29 TaxID=2973805 RepID=UPI0025B1C46E
ARDSADQAALDAEAARTAASQAEQAAKDARAAAERADAAATEAEEAAKDAEKYAKEAQEAASRTETEGKNSSIRTGASAGGIGNLFYVDRIEVIGDPEHVKKENCGVIIHTGDCQVTATIRHNVEIDVYLCTALDLPAPQAGCPEWETLFLGTQLVKNQKSTVTKTISMVEFNSGIDPVDILLGHWIDCAQKVAPGGESGNWGGCGWASFDIAAFLFGGKITQAVVDGIRALDASLRTGIGVSDAYKALRVLNMDAGALANIGRTVAAYQDDVATACKVGSSLSLMRAAAASGLPCKFWKLIDYNGQRVYQRDDLIRPDYVSPNDNYGRTNLKRMQQGLAPMGPDDQPLNLHHMLQTQDGPIAEVTKRMHLDENYHQLHWKSGTKIPSGIDRPEFKKWKEQYWKDRAKGFSQ